MHSDKIQLMKFPLPQNSELLKGIKYGLEVKILEYLVTNFPSEKHSQAEGRTPLSGCSSYLITQQVSINLRPGLIDGYFSLTDWSYQSIEVFSF